VRKGSQQDDEDGVFDEIRSEEDSVCDKIRSENKKMSVTGFV